jgi:signal transduction histidine kinase
VGRLSAGWTSLRSGLARIGRHLRRGAAAYGVLLIALLLTLLACSYVRQNVEAQARTRFEETTQATKAAIYRRVNAYLAAMFGARGLLLGSYPVEQDERDSHVRSLDLYFATLPAFERGAKSNLPAFVLVSGVSVSLLLFGITWMLARSRTRAFRASADLKEVNLELEQANAELQRSRESLVNTREEERRRLRRDLHDGVGPQLAALMLQLETASDLVSENHQASALMAKLSKHTSQIVSDVRRSVDALRPPALDELGLLEALREQASNYSPAGLRVSVEYSEELSELPAAVEVACYRIVQEALTNVVRHARASNCSIRIRLDEEAGALIVEVQDDGRGIKDEDRAGVGMSSMRERTEELGGRCTVKAIAGGGTLIRALLPFQIKEEVPPTEEE